MPLTNAQKDFLYQIKTVSGDLAGWVQTKFQEGWSIEDVKIAITNAMNVCKGW